MVKSMLIESCDFYDFKLKTIEKMIQTTAKTIASAIIVANSHQKHVNIILEKFSNLGNHSMTISISPFVSPDNINVIYLSIS